MFFIFYVYFETILKGKIRKKRKETNHHRFESSLLNLIHVECKYTNLTHFTMDWSKTGDTTFLFCGDFGGTNENLRLI